MKKYIYALLIILLLTISLSVQALPQSAQSDTTVQYDQTNTVCLLPKDSDNDIAVLNTNWESVGILLNDQNNGFYECENYTTEGLALDICVGDFNLDYTKDIAVCDIVDGLVTVLLGDGYGSFTKHQTFNGGRYTQQIITFDVNFDGYLDLLTTLCYDEEIRIFYGDGSGTFSSYASLPAGDCPYALAYADLNDDTLIDLVVSDYDVCNLIIFEGLSTGNFSEVIQLPTHGLDPEHIEIADFNDDNHQDIAVLNKDYDGPLTVYLGDSMFSFSDAVISSVVGVPKCFTVEDFDSDGIVDVAVTDSANNALYVFSGIGNGSFEDYERYSVGTGPWGVTSGHLNEDSYVDVVVANFGIDRSITVLYGSEVGEFVESTEYKVGYGPTKVVIDQFNQGTAPSAPSITGPDEGKIDTIYDFTISSVDADGDMLSYLVDWGDNTPLEWQDGYASGDEVVFSHSWDEEGSYQIRVKAKDSDQQESEWSSYSVRMPHHSLSEPGLLFQMFQKLLFFFESQLKIF